MRAHLARTGGNAAGHTAIPTRGGSKMMYNRKKDSTVRENRHGRGLGSRVATRLTTTAFACAATITLAIVALVNAGQVGAVTRWAGDSGFGAPYPMSVAHVADPAPESATRSLTDRVLEVPESSHELLPEGCGLLASDTGLGESAYATPPQDHDCPPEAHAENLRDTVGCMINILPFVGGYRCRYGDTCPLTRKFERTRSITVTSEDGTFSITITEKEAMCGYGECGAFNVADVPIPN